MRKGFVNSNCIHCRKTIMPIEEANSKMDINNRIDTIDSYEWENFKMVKHPIFRKLKFDGYPTFFLDNRKVHSILTKNQFRAFLDGFTGKDKNVPDNANKWRRGK